MKEVGLLLPKEDVDGVVCGKEDLKPVQRLE